MLRLVVLTVSLGALVVTFVFRASSRRKSRTNSKVAIAESSALVPSRPGVLSAGDFRGLFFLLVSLLHGTLFFTLLGETLSMAESASLAFWSAAAVNFAVFFRVLQSQLAAALRYDQHWSLAPFDFIAVFIAAGLEYLLFVHQGFSWGGEHFRLVLVAAFGLFGALSYVGTFARVKSGLQSGQRMGELLFHGSNVLLMMACVVAALAALIWPHRIPVVVTDLWIVLCLAVNMYISMRRLMYARLIAKAEA